MSGHAKDHPYDAIQSMLEEFGETFNMDTETPSTLTFYMPSDFHATTSDTYTLDQAISRLKNGMITTFGTGGTDCDGVNHYLEGHIEPLIDDTYIAAGSANVDRIR